VPVLFNMFAVKAVQKRGRRAALSPLAEDVADQPATKRELLTPLIMVLSPET